MKERIELERCPYLHSEVSACQTHKGLRRRTLANVERRRRPQTPTAAQEDRGETARRLRGGRGEAAERPRGAAEEDNRRSKLM